MTTIMYCPESPAHSECAYVPESPARSECAYEPESPMKCDVSTAEGILARLLGGIQKPCKKSPKYTPIHAWRSYIRLMIINEKNKLKNAKYATEYTPYSQEFKKEYAFRVAQYEVTKLKMVEVAWNERKIEERKEVLTSFIKAWRDSCPTPRKVPNKPIDKNINYFEKVVTKLDVDKNGHVHVNISVPFATLHEKYFQKLLKPPIDEYVQVLTDIGYPKWVINRMVRKHHPSDDPVKTVQESFDSKDFKKAKSKKQVSTLNKFKLK